MHSLIQGIVRQTTTLLATLATLDGARAPLADVANQVFLDLSRELESQGVGRKVVADMFGLALRSYQRKVNRLAESSTDSGRTLWEAVLDHVSRHERLSRIEILRRFHRDEEDMVRGVLNDLASSGLVVRDGHGVDTVYRRATDEDVRRLRGADDESARVLLWAWIYRNGPIDRSGLVAAGVLDPATLTRALDGLEAEGKIRRTAAGWAADTFIVPMDAPSGWEAAVYDHFHAVVRSICARLQRETALPERPQASGGSTYSFTVWPGHPHAELAYDTLARARAAADETRETILAWNEANPRPESTHEVTFYLGQSVLLRDEGSA